MSVVAFLSPGAIFGTPHVSPDYFALVALAHAPIKEGDDPMKDLRGEPNFDTADVAILRMHELSDLLP